jgi:hypothetical protein
MKRDIPNKDGPYVSVRVPEMIQAVLSKEASTASGTVIRTNQSFG